MNRSEAWTMFLVGSALLLAMALLLWRLKGHL
jgi:hypothetical protein